ncbi:hypothetical protein ACFFGT_07820 [Mucilaginibacter angelicae]|uniref:Glycosyltransferase subfamily 4-like N-terminal domain-containing protein n=1 Tax=Mucilaginibacter angelicae TaxID=869718 RepID=A0ABV6L3P3_9SPHI
MRILLVCGSLEPGRDGVGDYSQKLAREFVKQGHQVFLFALNDRHITTLIERAGDEGIAEIRLSASMDARTRFAKLKEVTDAFTPDWISLQYVGYSFNKRGIVFDLAKQLRRLKTGANVHVMFHEIWQGESKDSTLKDKIIGFFQKRSAIAVVKALKPKCISTTNGYYQKSLSKAGIDTNKIPVFSNMPLGDHTRRKIYEQLPANYRIDNTAYVLACFFGGFHYHDLLAERIKQLSVSINDQFNKKLIITHAGKSPGIKEQFSKLNEVTGIQMHVLGEWAENDIADYLGTCDVSLSNHPKVLFEKSGSIAAALYNQCPVIILRDGFANDDQKRDEIEELKYITDIKKFINQDPGFAEKYSPKNAAEQYSAMFKLSVKS